MSYWHTLATVQTIVICYMYVKLVNLQDRYENHTHRNNDDYSKIR